MFLNIYRPFDVFNLSDPYSKGKRLSQLLDKMPKILRIAKYQKEKFNLDVLRNNFTGNFM